VVSPRGFENRMMSAARRTRLMAETCAAAPDPGQFRVFGYGSLMWNPCFDPVASVIADLPGYERRFCLLTTRARGTPERPGLGLGLVPGRRGCRGIAYQLKPATLDRDVEALFEREMGTGIYRPAWLEARAGTQALAVLAFVADTAHPQYTGELELDEVVAMISKARGRYGSCRDYLANTVAELTRMGIAEPGFEALLEHVDRRSRGILNRA
jgi:cation transport protein ChaC